MSVEQELLEATGFTPKKKYPDRQDYLAALARASLNLEDEEFEVLSNEAADWSNDAVKAIREKAEIADFPDVEPAAEVAEEPVAALEAELEAEPEDDEAPVEAKAPARRKKGKPARMLEHPEVLDAKEATDAPFLTDRFGVAVGSKNAAAIAMFEKGARMADVTASIGGTYYNLLTRLVKEGHVLKKGANGVITLEHSKDVQGK